MPHVAHAPGREAARAVRSHVWHISQAEGGACGARATRGTCVGQGAARAVCMPHVAHAPGGGAERAVRSHMWHIRQAEGGACGVRATCGTCAG
eukprot:scaffold106386_cov60-Phaeocystis_antarctica.AAC.1